jgi:hypothetical protein
MLHDYGFRFCSKHNISASVKRVAIGKQISTESLSFLIPQDKHTAPPFHEDQP